MSRTLSAYLLATMTVVTLSPCDAQDAENSALENSEVVASIKSVEIMIQTSNPPNFVVEATAQVPTGGYSNFVLSRAVYTHPPDDGIQDYYFHATPPSGPAPQVITDIKARNRWRGSSDWVVGVRIHGAGDGVLVKTLGDDSGKDNDVARKIDRIVVPDINVRVFSVTGRSTLFRISVSTPAGGTIENPVSSGNAKHLRTAEITTVNEEGELTGELVREFEFRGTEAGKVRIEVKRTTPTSPMPIADIFEVTID